MRRPEEVAHGLRVLPAGRGVHPRHVVHRRGVAGKEVKRGVGTYTLDISHVLVPSFRCLSAPQLYMDVHEAFSCFANLLSSHFYFDFFRLDPEKINGHLAVYDALLQECLPGLFAHFQREEVQSEMYMIDWLLTLYSRSMPLDVAARV